MTQQLLPMLGVGLVTLAVVVFLVWRVIGRVTKPGLVRALLRVGALSAIGGVLLVGAPRLLPTPGSSAFSAARQNVTPTDSTVVEQGSLTLTLNATGNLAPGEQIGLTFQNGGSPVAEVLVEPGQMVKAGDVLARLDLTDAESALRSANIELAASQNAYNELVAPARGVDIAVARAQVNVALASLSSASEGADPNDVEAARLQVELARNNVWQSQLSRDKTLQTNPEFRTGNGGAQAQEIGLDASIAQAEYNVQIQEQEYQDIANEVPDVGGLSSANASLIKAQNNLADLTGSPNSTELANTEIDLNDAQLSVERAAAEVRRGMLTAPFDGMIAAENLSVGELPPSDDAVVLIDINTYTINLQIDETDIGTIRVGQTVILTVDALPDAEITGTITKIEPAPVVDGQRVTYTARAMLDPTTAALRPNMSATARIITTQLENVIVVPNRFIHIDSGTQRAFVTVKTDDGRYREVGVELGARNENESQIISGLEVGQELVLLPETATPQQGGFFMGPPPGGGGGPPPGGGGGRP